MCPRRSQGGTGGSVPVDPCGIGTGIVTQDWELPLPSRGGLSGGAAGVSG